MTGYEKIKRLAKEKRCNVTDLLVLARQNDPFYTGSATDRAIEIYNKPDGTILTP